MADTANNPAIPTATPTPSAGPSREPPTDGKGIAFGRGVAYLDENLKGRDTQDVCFLAVFMLCTVGSIVLSLVSGVSNPMRSEESRDIFWIAFGVTFAWGQIWLLLTRFCAKEIAYIGVLLCVVATGLACYNFALLALNSLDAWISALYWVFCGLTGVSMLLVMFFFCMYREKLAVTIALLECSAKALMTEPLMYFVAMLVVLAELLAVIVFTSGLETVLAWEGYTWLSIFIVFYLYWFLWAVDGVMRVTIGGGMFIWYFTLGEPSRYARCPLLGCLFRAVTTSLGPVARGSFFLAIISMIVSMLNSMQRKLDKGEGGCIVCFLKVIICCVKGACMMCLSMMEFVTNYAYVFVGVKGCDFKTAGQDVNQLLDKYGMTAILSDVLTRWISRLGQLLGMALSVVCMYAYTANQAESYDSVASDGVVFFMGVFISYIMMATFTAVTDCGVDAMLVCYSLDQQQSETSGTTFAPKQLQDVITKAGGGKAPEPKSNV